MENEAAMTRGNMKVEIPESTSPKTGMNCNGGLSRQGSIARHNCLCSPTTHAGSFRCRLHRGAGLHMTRNTDLQVCQDSQSKVNTSSAPVPNSN